MQTLEHFMTDLDRALQGCRGPEEASCQTCDILRKYSQERIELPVELTQNGNECYARHLIHRSQPNGYCVVAMVWGPGQGTAVHDHGGTWCVEGCMQGELQITSYRLNEETAAGISLSREGSVNVSPGCVGCLIPPFEHHKIENVSGANAITIHVYGEELLKCRRYLPREDGLYRTEMGCLSYNSEHAGRFLS